MSLSRCTMSAVRGISPTTAARCTRSLCSGMMLTLHRVVIMMTNLSDVAQPVPDNRDWLGKIVRDTWVEAVHELIPDPKPSWTEPWETLADPFQREVDKRIGEAVAKGVVSQIKAMFLPDLPEMP